jgi:hypothetical protein
MFLLLDQNCQVASKKEQNLFIEKVTNTRNYLTHFTEELKAEAVLDPEGLHDLIEKMRLILQICFLEQIGFPFSEISKIFKSKIHYSMQYFS